MKSKYVIFVLLLLVVLASSFQCDKCVEQPDQFLDASRNWLPLKGKTELRFLDDAGRVKTFSLTVTDTIETRSSCPSSFQEEYIRGQLFLNASKSDYINFGLDQTRFLCVAAISNTLTQFNVCDVLSKAGSEAEVIKLSNYNFGGRIYPDMILLKSAAGSATIDSVFIANNIGIAGFQYNGISHIIQ